MKRLAVILTVVFIVPFFSACGEKAEEGSAPTAGSDSYNWVSSEGGQKSGSAAFPSVGPDYTNNAIANFDGEYEEVDNMQHPVAFITMESGAVIKAELYPEKAPETVNNFIYLANQRKFYDGLIFHRVISNFMIQGGCPEGTGKGGPGYTIKGEFAANGFTQNNIAHVPGVLSMARLSFPYDSAGSQFFICVGECSHLNGQYAAFGMVTEGMEAVYEISGVATGMLDKPKEPQVIKSIWVDTRGVDYPRPESAK